MKYYDPTPVIGYSEGLIISDDPPVREFTDRGDLPKGNKANPNDWFYIETRRFNVHPFRSDLGGYPIRWIETVAPPTYSTNDLSPTMLKFIELLNDGWVLHMSDDPPPWGFKCGLVRMGSIYHFNTSTVRALQKRGIIDGNGVLNA